MKTVFGHRLLDRQVRPNDQWKDAATKARDELGRVRLVTTDEVLGIPRARAERVCTRGGKNSSCRIRTSELFRSPETFRKGLERYEARSDKGYSLQDCISMNTMESHSITEILTNDRHFEQEGFSVLMKGNGS